MGSGRMKKKTHGTVKVAGRRGGGSEAMREASSKTRGRI